MKPTQLLRLKVAGFDLGEVRYKDSLNMVTGCQYFAVQGAAKAMDIVHKVTGRTAHTGTWEGVKVEIELVEPTKKLVTKGKKS